MPTALVPPRRTYHLRVFGISLLIVVTCLVAFLFAVRLEAIMPGAGVIAARGQEEVRAPLAGLVELGWYEGSLRADGKVKVRVDGQGNGVTDPVHGSTLAIAQYKLMDGREVAVESLTYHKLAAGDELWPGQMLADIRSETESVHAQLRELKARLSDLHSRGEPTREVRERCILLEERLARATLRVPDQHGHWLVLKVYPESRQAVAAGDPVALLAPLDPARHQPRAFIAIIDVHEKHVGDLTPGQTVRLYSMMYNQRLHGHAEGVIEKLEPHGEPLPSGERRFRAVAAVTSSPFPLRPGSSFKAEIVVGRKQVYRIILEQ